MSEQLLMPVVCECGYATLDARKAIEHIKKYHPENWPEELDREES